MLNLDLGIYCTDFMKNLWKKCRPSFVNSTWDSSPAHSSEWRTDIRYDLYCSHSPTVVSMALTYVVCRQSIIVLCQPCSCEQPGWAWGTWLLLCLCLGEMRQWHNKEPLEHWEASRGLIRERDFVSHVGGGWSFSHRGNPSFKPEEFKWEQLHCCRWKTFIKLHKAHKWIQLEPPVEV